jgi:hypothetical protein
MGLDATIRRRDGEPLGEVDAVIAKLAELWPGAEFGRGQSGEEQVAAAAKRGVKFPDALIASLMPLPATMQGVFHSEPYSVELDLGSEPIVKHVHVVFRGMHELVEERIHALGWAIDFHI